MVRSKDFCSELVKQKILLNHAIKAINQNFTVYWNIVCEMKAHIVDKTYKEKINKFVL